MLKLVARVAACALGLCASLGSAMGQDYPVRPARIIVPFAPGGGNDFIARFVGTRLSGSLGQQFVVENRPGAGGQLGVDLGVSAPADGYTLTLISLSYTVNPALYKLKFNPVTDITPVVQISQGALVLVAHPSVAARTVSDLVARARAQSDRVTYASSGQGSIIHLATELFAMMAGIRMTHVPYKGGGPALTDTLSGQTDIFMGSTAAVLPFVKSGKLRALAVTTPHRVPAEPEIPTLAEAGIRGYEVTLWHGLIGPRDMPRRIVERLNREVNRAIQLKEAAELLQGDGVSPSGGTPEQFLAVIKADVQRWDAVVRQAGVRVE